MGAADLRVVRVAEAFPLDVRIAKRMNSADYVVIDSDGDVLTNPQPTRAEAEADLEEIELQRGLDQPDEDAPYERYKQAQLDVVRL